MSITRSRALSVLGVFAFASLLSAQSPESIPNWTAPPFWTPPRALAPERFTRAGELEPLAVEAVPTGPLPFFGIAPCRLLDTRPPANNPLDGDGIYGTDEIRTYTLPTSCGLPAGAQAVSLNVTATNTGSGAFGHIKIWPADQTEPNVSTLNYPGPGATLANAAIVPLSNTGAIKVKSGNTGADVILDVNGYYAPISIVNTVNGLSGAVTLAPGTDVSITPSGQTLTIANTAPAGWRLTGNSGTTAGTNFLGTTDNQALEIKVNGERALRIEPLTPSATWGPNVIGGFSGNFVTGGKVGATIGGGGQTGLVNRVAGDFGTVGGGWNNEAAGYAAVVIGGRGNTASGNQATLGAGQDNTASGDFSTVPGGLNNTASGSYDFAAGRRAKASHAGTFVWGDGTNADISSTGSNQFIARATGGFAFLPAPGVVCGLTDVTGWQCASVSDRASKENIAPVDGREALARLRAMPIRTWSYTGQDPAVRHMGPMAQDFAAAYGLGADEKTINPLDANGVALASIQALYEIVREKDAEIDVLKARLSKLEAAPK